MVMYLGLNSNWTSPPSSKIWNYEGFVDLETKKIRLRLLGGGGGRGWASSLSAIASKLNIRVGLSQCKGLRFQHEQVSHS